MHTLESWTAIDLVHLDLELDPTVTFSLLLLGNMLRDDNLGGCNHPWNFSHSVRDLRQIFYTKCHSLIG